MSDSKGIMSNRNSNLFLTLPNNFSPGGGDRSSPDLHGSPSPGSTSERKGSSGGGSATMRGSPLSTHHHHYSWEDLRRLFLVSLEKLSRMEPESIPFRQPVDPEELGIPDYHDIIRRPMDLQTIRNKMNSGKYTDPYGYVDDVLRMLDNAWLYNREGSKIYEYCTRLSTVFVQEVNPVLTHLGYKQGRTNSYNFNSDTVTCHGRPVCFVTKHRGFWRDTSRDIEFNLCEDCYKNMFSNEPSSPPDVIPCTTPGSVTSNQDHQQSNFVFTINSSKAYSPAAELHKSHMRDAEMSRQMVLREFLRMLLADKTESRVNVFKMLRCNGKLLNEFIAYVTRRRVMASGSGDRKSGDCCVVYGESFTTKDLDGLLNKLEALKKEDEEQKRTKTTDEEKSGTVRSDSGVESEMISSSNETLDEMCDSLEQSSISRE